MYRLRQYNICADSPVHCVKLSFNPELQQPIVSDYFPNLADFYEKKGNLFALTNGLNQHELGLITLKTAELLSYTHSQHWVHGHVSPWAFILDKQYITLVDIDLYRQAQERLESIPLSEAHGYKARAELVIGEAVVPTVAMDAYAWAKTIVTLYSRSIFQPQTPRHVHHLTKPQNMPEGIWRIVRQCLSEDLHIQVNMAQVVAQLRSIVWLAT